MTETQTTSTPVQNWPLLFAYRDSLYGKGFVVDVSVRGRALATKYSDQEVWINGVNPGGMAEHGINLEAAHAAFRKAFTAVLFDLATDSASFEAFKSAVEVFVHETNDVVAAEWQAAVLEVRAGKIRPEDVGLVTAQAERQITVDVIARRDFKPSDNVLEQEPALAA